MARLKDEQEQSLEQDARRQAIIHIRTSAQICSASPRLICGASHSTNKKSRLARWWARSGSQLLCRQFCRYWQLLQLLQLLTATRQVTSFGTILQT
jgi:hypothetical protein